ncbi:glycoside hydrolase family 95 protein [Streptomyces sp. BE20]|uniref:glycoside hydrolase family 95 protein n=1 Tax=Streptomyces sp. BE20 TaxID=3002525 RepID=UPI002E79E9D8|nr:glycoside hydrolase family 95 protein [Streptomyces sp. BE20]MEE1820897.1 glycoside hydrolase family 95 protein [Streptomyces sp. BE20]
MEPTRRVTQDSGPEAPVDQFHLTPATEEQVTTGETNRGVSRRAFVAGVSGGLAAVTLPLALSTAQQAAAAATADPETLWYDQPASAWETQALPIGNGALGAMVFGGVASERLQFNEKSLWTGGPGSPGYNYGNWPVPRPGALAQVIDAIDASGKADPNWVAGKLGAPRTGFGYYQTFGDLYLDMIGSSSTYTGYRRSLDIGDAVAKVNYTAGGTTFSREYFASYPGKVIAGRISADQPGRISFTLRYTSPRTDFTATAVNGRLTVRGKLADNGLDFESQTQVKAVGGTVTSSGDRVTVTGADSVVLVTGAGTNYALSYPAYRGVDPHARVTSAVDAAIAASYDALKSAHLADYRTLYDRVKLNVGQVMPDKPTNTLRDEYTGGSSTADRALEALFFQYGRYLLISSSRAGSLPANLQGVWNSSTNPPWFSDYHTNINVQMNYWPALQTNLFEAMSPFVDLVKDLSKAGTTTASQMFGTPGWVTHNCTNPFGNTGVGNYGTAFWFPEANAWLASQLYDWYRFTGNTQQLRDDVYPVLKGAAEFWLANLRTDPRDGKLVANPSFSPEHGSFTAGDSMAQQIVWGLLTDTLAAARTLNTDTDLQSRLTSALASLDPGLRIGSWGQLQEWKADLDQSTDHHRHVSHLYALHPGNQISPRSNPTLTAAAKVSLNARGETAGDAGTGWSLAWKVNFWARLLDGNRAQSVLSEQLKSSTYPNLLDTAPPFQIDGNFGATAGITEMLLQSQNGEIQPLPALPAAWKTGSYSGLKARGNASVGATWSANGSVTFTITPWVPQQLSVRSPIFNGAYTVTDTNTGQVVTTARTGERITFAGTGYHVYKITGTLVR